jgi:thioredoxin reductase (NADPH)
MVNDDATPSKAQRRRYVMYDMIILGGGAAGLAAAAYALNKQLNVVLITEALGGKAGTQQQLHNQSGEEELLGADTVQLLARRVAARAGAVLHDRVIGITKHNGIFHVETQHQARLKAHVVLVATGAAPLPLDVPGAHKLVNYGVGYSITTHAHLLEGKTVAVIGTTGRALLGAVELATIGAYVYLIALDATGMTTPLARRLRHMPQVTVFERYQVTQIAGTTSVEHLVARRGEEEAILRVDAVFADRGLLPNSGLVRQLIPVDLDGFIWVDDRNMTALPGLFAAGDVTTAFAENILVAAGDGTRAAISAYTYLLGQKPQPEAEPVD